MGKIKTLVAIEQIKVEGAKQLDTRVYDPDKDSSYDLFPDYK